MTDMNILIVNGPNLNLLGTREPDMYGQVPFSEYLAGLPVTFPGTMISYFQSNSEGELIDHLQQAEGVFDGIVLNAGAYTHTSIAIADAIRCLSVPVIEVHISNVYKRESFRHKSLISPHCKGVIVGFGLHSYTCAIQAFLN